MEYAVFSRRILTGTVSDLNPSTRIAWITILFEAERLHGKVKLPVRDLAKMASITTPEAAEALRIFQDPDPYSSSKEHDGRRLLPIPGEEDWYTVATWEKHAEERSAFFARLRQQRARARKGVTEDNAASRSVTVSHASSRSVTNEPEPEPEESKDPKSKASRPRRKAASDTPRWSDDSREMKASAYLFGKIRGNNPRAKEPNWQGWAREFDLIFRVDERDPGELRAMIDWCQADAFWHKNILSPATLRKQFDRFVGEMKAPRKGQLVHEGPKAAPHHPSFRDAI